MQTFKLLGLLLTYPQPQLQSALSACVEVFQQEGLVSKRQLKLLQAFIKDKESKDLIDWQEEYVGTFDRSRNHCLYLFEHIHGESRDRGSAMVDMKEMYAAKGLQIDSNELPDYLPLFLEYLSFCEIKEATELLGEAIDVIATIGAHLKKSNSDYFSVFKTIENLPNIKIDRDKVALAVQGAAKDPETFEELDKEWEEVAAFDNSANDCGDCNSQQRPSGDIQ